MNNLLFNFKEFMVYYFLFNYVLRYFELLFGVYLNIFKIILKKEIKDSRLIF